jgi:hypothetical protein
MVVAKTKDYEMGKESSTHGREEGYVQGKPEGKRSLGKPRRRWENNYKFFVEK